MSSREPSVTSVKLGTLYQSKLNQTKQNRESVRIRGFVLSFIRGRLFGGRSYLCVEGNHMRQRTVAVVVGMIRIRGASLADVVIASFPRVLSSLDDIERLHEKMKRRDRNKKWKNRALLIVKRVRKNSVGHGE